MMSVSVCEIIFLRSSSLQPETPHWTLKKSKKDTGGLSRSEEFPLESSN